jgi:hypothetical protein
METKLSSFMPSLLALVLLSGCAGSKYTARSLAKLPQKHAFTSSNADVNGSYTVLNAKACNTYLDRNVIKAGYQPIYISINNDSNHLVTFSLDDISVPVVPADQVAKAVHSNTAKRVFGFAIPGIILGTIYSQMWSFVIRESKAPSNNDAGVYIAAFVLIPVALFFFIPYTIAAIATSTRSVKFNKNIDTNFAMQSLVDQPIHPGNTINGLIFVPNKDFNPNLQITLTDAMAKQVVLQS